MKHYLFSFFLTCIGVSRAFAWEAKGNGALVELYTSEGCSSCPPADAWLSNLRSYPGLWSEVVPIAFHVDYWDGLGWPDKFASGRYTSRQRAYANLWKSSTIFTPAVITMGENSGVTRSFPKVKTQLQATWLNDKLVVRGADALSGTVHATWLAMEVFSDVKRGENAGRKLQHDFIVLEHVELGAYKAGETLLLAQPKSPVAPVKALVVWIEAEGRPIVAVGGPLN